ncbi:MAG: alpha/beta hydrolase [Bacteroidales bacterium]|nr:alpha/beta hydrolase [Bacteroidales bacterium]
MKSNFLKLLSLLFSPSPFLLLSLSPLLLFAQSPLPSNWDSIVASPWYTGNVSNIPAFCYFNPEDPDTGYFFIADKALPQVIPVSVKWKKGVPRSAAFTYQSDKIKVKFTGTVSPDTIAGRIRTSRKSAIRLGISPELEILLIKEIPQIPQSPNLQIPKSPNPPTSLLPRYLSPIFKKVTVTKDIAYGAAPGHYVSMPIEKDSDYDYQQIILDALKNMWVNPGKKALLHLFNRDPVSFAVSDLQGLKMDLYEPEGDTLSFRPLILLLHGGAFILGDKATESIAELANDYARKGYVVASINYRIGFNPASKSSLERAAYRSVQDARAALRFLSYNAAQYKIDPGHILLGGSSAGAITALNTAFMDEDERPESTGGNIWQLQKDLGGLDESGNDISGQYTIRALLNLWGAVNDTAIIDAGEKIPVLSVHGDADKIVPYGYNYPFLDMDTNVTSNIVSKLYGSQYIHRRLVHLGFESELITLRHAGHEPQYEPGKYREVMDTIISRSTDFYFRALLHFPDIAGPRQVAIGMSPSSYSVPVQEGVSYYWQATGGKVLPGNQKNQARVVWLAKEKGTVSVVLYHRNGANAEVRLPVVLP